MKLTVSELHKAADFLKAGDKVQLSGVVFTARDAAHKRIADLLDRSETLPFPLYDSVIYYAGPTAAPPGRCIGSCGPTTSGRMDVYTPRLLNEGLLAMIGKGERCEAVREAIIRRKGLYFCAVGGAGALAAKCIASCEVVAFPELGCESVKRLTFNDFPLIVANDAFGGDIFSQGKAIYRKEARE